MDFPKELLEELLIRVPLKSIQKFKCVSKDWNNIISCTKFRRRYQFRYRNDARPCGFFYHHYNPIFSPFQYNNPCMPIKGQAIFINTSNIANQELGLCVDMQQLGYVIGSSKGLVLLSRNPMSYHVYDPLTKRHVRLPKILKKYKFVCTGFICKELEQNFPNIINNDSSHLTYKVVRIGNPIPLVDTTTYKVETYSSETGKWRKSKMTCALNFCLMPQCTAKVIGGVLHWENYRVNDVIAYDPEDLSGHATLIEYPIPGSSKNITGTQDGRLLCLIEWFTGIDVFVLGGKYDGRNYLNEDIIDRNQWIKSHTIDFEKLGLTKFYFEPNGCAYFGHAIDIHYQDSNVIFLESSTEVLSCNLNENSIETRSSKGEEQMPFMYPQAATYHYVEWPSWPCF